MPKRKEQKFNENNHPVRKSEFDPEREAYMDKDGNYVYNTWVQQPNGLWELKPVCTAMIGEDDISAEITIVLDDMPVKVKPYAHQQNAFDFACGLFGLTTFEETSSGAALLMEMGTGKSLVGLAIAGILFRFSLIERVLVVCPLSIMGVWEDELAKFADYPYSNHRPGDLRQSAGNHGSAVSGK